MIIMSKVTGISVSLKTEPGEDTGTDDHVYLGVCGTRGGREFALNVDEYDDWEPGSEDDYGFGSPTTGGREPTTAAARLNNMAIHLEGITHVYLRKQGDRTHDADDYWEVSKCIVIISTPNESRLFSLKGKARLGNEFGHKVWLSDSAENPDSTNVHSQMLREVGAKSEVEQE